MEYVSVENQKLIEPRYRLAILIVLGFAASVLLYLLIARFITPRTFAPGSERWAQPIYSAAIVIGLCVVVLRRLLLARMTMASAVARGPQAVLGRLLALTVVCSALAELVAIGGLFGYLVTADYQYSWRLGVISLLLLAYSFPRRAEWNRAVTAGADAQHKFAGN